MKPHWPYNGTMTMSSEQLIPTLDISRFTSGADADSLAIAREVNKACERIGFLVIEGHGVPGQIIEKLDDCSRQSIIFFHIPNYDATVECIPSCADSENPARYDPITVGNHHLMKMGKMFDVEDEQH